MNYEAFKEEFEGLGEVQPKQFDWMFVVSAVNIDIGYDRRLDSFSVDKDGVILDFGIDIDTAKLILKVAKPKMEKTNE